ncbi:unnamed protein product [Hermetia illucens]|uniref:Deltamethrin resistance protein prag01 domain-containing protein n=1 Tax=Hermetia illucens TaxID=343691 RepID=A0A7R8UHU4_HERIL|nr:uncharacterized protein LOC119649364 [Hermetia illucens]CAD7080965.1 unnamed protein product [Hermetia illucens]
MLARQIILRSLAARNAGALSRAYHGGHHKVATMNDLPVPQGDWQEAYQKKQAKYNAVLVAGIAMLATAIGLAKSTGLIQLNFSPPKSLD